MKRKGLTLIIVLAMILALALPAFGDSGVPEVSVSSQSITVDGEKVELEVYNIGGSNYFKLRDIAMLLRGTDAEFSVSYDSAAGAVTAQSGGTYVPNGGELEKGADKSSTCVESSQSFTVDGKERDVYVYNIGGSNFFKLRDLGAFLGFGVTYNEETKTVTITTDTVQVGKYTSGGRNVQADRYDTGGYLQFADKALWLGTLSGQWYDIGYVIGAQSAEMIAASTDYWWKDACLNRGVEATVAAMDQYAFQIDALDPTQIDLLKGITDGAAKALAEAEFGDKSNPDYAGDFYRVMNASIFDSWLWGDPDSYQSESAGQNDSAGDYIIKGCNSIAVKGSATADGSTITSQCRHTQQAGLTYQTAMVYESLDGEFNTFWTVGNVPAANGLLLVNDKGVSISHHFGGATTEESLSYGCYGSAYGVPWPNMLFYVIKEADTAEEALDIIEHGNERYREITGRKTVLRDGAWNWMVCDEETLSVIEVSPDRYAVRYAGEYTGEDWTDPDYIVCANHFLCPYSYDENDNLTDVPMTIFNAMPDSVDRFWNLMWEVETYKGDIDVYTLQYIFSQTYLRDKDTGEYIYVMQDEEGNYLPTGQAYACAQGGLTGNGLVSGTNGCKIAVLDGENSTAYFCLGNPKDWMGEWDKFEFGG